ncbi:hypothetical protein [Microbispora sp. NPDC049125]|uniref:hypothetical protein n=1 Tax=Microbispora sp. NPDC049125 TaxID=3154929 RepID=UPI00346771F7
MDAEIATLAMSGAGTIVGLMATDAWSAFKARIASLYATYKPSSKELVELELEESRVELASAQDTSDSETERELRLQWQGKLRRFLVANPDALAAFREIVEEFAAELPDSSRPRIGRIEMHGEASSGGRVYQQGQGTQYNK